MLKTHLVLHRFCPVVAETKTRTFIGDTDVLTITYTAAYFSKREAIAIDLLTPLRQTRVNNGSMSHGSMGQFLCGSVGHGSLPVSHCLLCARLWRKKTKQIMSSVTDSLVLTFSLHLQIIWFGGNLRLMMTIQSRPTQASSVTDERHWRSAMSAPHIRPARPWRQGF